MVLHLLIFLLWFVYLLLLWIRALQEGGQLQAKVNFLHLSQGAAQLMMDRIGDDGLVVDGRKVFFEYRSVLWLIASMNLVCPSVRFLFWSFLRV